jgi:FemAB-related protein (PEP-CTERM system-associated)
MVTFAAANAAPPIPTAARAPLAVSVSVETEGAEWDAFLESHPDATVEHLWGWREVYARAFGHDCVYLAARRGGRVAGVLPLVRHRSWLFGRFVLSLPFFNYAGIVAEDADVARALAEAAEAIGRAHGATHLEFRHRERQLPDLPFQQKKLGFSRPLPESSDALWTSLDRKVRNQVRKAQKDGLTADSGGAELADDFYAVFATNMRDLGTPVFPRALFTETARVLPGRTRFFIVRSGGRPIAGGVALFFRDTVLVPWASSLREFRQHSPNMLLYWSMMEWAIGQGARVFDFGRSSIGAGTQQFKEQWGGVPRPLFTEYRLLTRATVPDQGTTSPKMRMAIRLWSRLPVSLATTAGSLVSRHLA